MLKKHLSYNIIICDVKIVNELTDINMENFKMKKKGICILPALVAALLLSAAMPPYTAYATGQDTEEKQSETAETEFPESYYLPIESNSIEGWPAGPQIEAEAAVVIDAKTGTFLYGKNMEAKEYPASITKIMTTLVALEHGELNSKLKFSDRAINSLEPDSSRLWMEVGEKITLKQALYGVMLASANDCANAVAEKVGGSLEEFAEMMNKKAEELGCVNTHFVNAHGLHDDNHYTCAKDMAIIMKAAMENKTFAKIVKTTEYSYPKTNKTKEPRYFMNHHKMLLDDEFYYQGCVGGKTGYTDSSLNTLVTVAKKDGRKLICVVLRTNGSNKTFIETAQLFDYGFENFVREEIPITDGQTKRADILGVTYIGKASVMEAETLKEPTIFSDSKVTVSLPKEANVKDVVRKLRSGEGLNYTYNQWPVGTASLKFNTFDFEIPEWEIKNVNVPSQDAEQMTEPDTDAKGFVEKAGDMIKGGLKGIENAWTSAWDWIYENDVFAAIVGLILIILLLPMLIIAYIRNRSSQKIRKQRLKEKEERIRIEKDIDSKSAIEIEEELRVRLNNEKLQKEQREAKQQERERIEKELNEAVKIIETKEAIEEASTVETEAITGLEEGQKAEEQKAEEKKQDETVQEAQNDSAELEKED